MNAIWVDLAMKSRQYHQNQPKSAKIDQNRLKYWILSCHIWILVNYTWFFRAVHRFQSAHIARFKFRMVRFLHCIYKQWCSVHAKCPEKMTEHVNFEFLVKFCTIYMTINRYGNRLLVFLITASRGSIFFGFDTCLF